MMMLEEYCPKSVKHMLEQEFENLTLKGHEIEAYTTRFNELATLCPQMVTPENKMTERYIWGLTPKLKKLCQHSCQRPLKISKTYPPC